MPPIIREILTSPATIRVLLIMALPIVAMVPGVTVDPVTDLITINPHVTWPWLVGGMAAGFGVYAVFGKK